MELSKIIANVDASMETNYEGTPCWNWTSGRDQFGYGVFMENGKYWRAHRYAYICANGELSDDLVVRHLCDNKSCCNPKHLRSGTQKENYQDSIDKHRESIYIPVTAYGVPYESKKAACEALGIHPVVLDKFLKDGIFDSEAYSKRETYEKHKERWNGPWVVDGVEYRTMRDVVEATGIPKHFISKYNVNGVVKSYECLKRMSGAWRIRKPNKQVPYNVRGVFYESREEASKASGIPPETLSEYSKNGLFDHERYDNRRAYTKTKEKRVGAFTVNGVEYPSMRKAAAATGIAGWKLHRYGKDGVYDPDLKKYKTKDTLSAVETKVIEIEVDEVIRKGVEQIERNLPWKG